MKYTVLILLMMVSSFYAVCDGDEYIKTNYLGVEISIENAKANKTTLSSNE